MKLNPVPSSIEEIEYILKNELALLFYFSTTSCSVAENVEPKVKNLISTHFPKISFYSIDMNFSPKIAAEFNVFVEPTILVFFDGKETIRKSRNFSLIELETAIKRPYELIFE